MLSINEISMGIVEEMLDYTEELKIEALELDNGSTVIDCGVNVEGATKLERCLPRYALAGLDLLG